jgi:multidrug efflux pump subunit AcrB
VPALLLFHQPFGFNAILGLIGLAGILMRNTLILTRRSPLKWKKPILLWWVRFAKRTV